MNKQVLALTLFLLAASLAFPWSETQRHIRNDGIWPVYGPLERKPVFFAASDQNVAKRVLWDLTAAQAGVIALAGVGAAMAMREKKA